MRIEFTGRKTEVAKPLRKLGERKLEKLARVLPGITRAHVVLSTDRHRQVAEVNVRSPHLDLRRPGGDGRLRRLHGRGLRQAERQAQHQRGQARWPRSGAAGAAAGAGAASPGRGSGRRRPRRGRARAPRRADSGQPGQGAVA